MQPHPCQPKVFNTQADAHRATAAPLQVARWGSFIARQGLRIRVLLTLVV